MKAMLSQPMGGKTDEEMFAFSLLTALHFSCIVIDIKSRVEAVNASTLFFVFRR